MVTKHEAWIEASVEWQGTVLDVTHFAKGSGLPEQFGGFDGIGDALERLEPGGVEHTSVGPLSLSIRHVPSEGSLPRKPTEWAPLGYVGLSMVFAGVLLVLMALVPPPGQVMSVPEQTLAGRLVPVETAPLEPELFETQPLATLDDDAQEERGAEWGPQGSAGAQTAREQAHRRGERESDATELRAAAERSGVLSLGGVFEGIGASQSPFERALGQDMDAALGNFTGSVSGESFGFGGLAMNGTGRHAGALGLDAIRRPDGGLEGFGLRMNGRCGCQAFPARSIGMGANLGHRVTGLTRGETDETGETRASGVPQIRSAGPEVRGALDPSLIRRVVRRHQNETRYCYEQALQTRPDLAGRVEARFVIAPGGAVVAATLESSTLSNARVEDCVLQVVRRMDFPAAPGGNVSVVSYPWVFSTL